MDIRIIQKLPALILLPAADTNVSVYIDHIFSLLAKLEKLTPQFANLPYSFPHTLYSYQKIIKKDVMFQTDNPVETPSQIRYIKSNNKNVLTLIQIPI